MTPNRTVHLQVLQLVAHTTCVITVALGTGGVPYLHSSRLSFCLPLELITPSLK